MSHTPNQLDEDFPDMAERIHELLVAQVARSPRIREIGVLNETGHWILASLPALPNYSNADRAYFEDKIEPLLMSAFVEYVGEIGDAEKSGFLGGADALLFPIDWPEPFGLVMIEAFACGTPVVTYRNGSTPEIMEHGVTGFLVSST